MTVGSRGFHHRVARSRATLAFATNISYLRPYGLLTLTLTLTLRPEHVLRESPAMENRMLARVRAYCIRYDTIVGI